MVDWVNKDYFTKTNLREIFITDSDVPKYVDLISEINKFSDGRRFGWTTRRREMENYVPYELIEQELKVSLDGYKATISNIRPECFSFSLPLLQSQKRFLATSANKAFAINRPVRFSPLLRSGVDVLAKSR